MDVHLRVRYYHSNLQSSSQDWKLSHTELLQLVDQLNDKGKPILTEKQRLENDFLLAITLERDNALAQNTTLQEDHHETTELLHAQINYL